MKEKKAVSYIESESSDAVLGKLSTYGTLTIAEPDLLKVEKSTNIDYFTYKLAYSTVKTLYDTGVSIFVLDISGRFHIMTAELIIQSKKEMPNIILVVAASADDLLECREKDETRYKYILANTDKLIYI